MLAFRRVKCYITTIMNERCPDFYPREELEEPEITHPQSYAVRKTYKDRVVVSIDELPGGDTITYFWDGGTHREYQMKNEERYTPPKRP
jgi:hypothetical protein